MSELDEKPQPYRPISLLSMRVGPLSLRAWVAIVLLGIGLLLFFKLTPPDISNQQYVKTLLSKGTLARTAGSLIRDAKPENTTAKEDAKWKAIADELAKCLENQARDYLASGEPFLNKHFERSTPNIIATRLFTACHAMKYLPKDDAK